jgi:hypothetical protein
MVKIIGQEISSDLPVKDSFWQRAKKRYHNLSPRQRYAFLAGAGFFSLLLAVLVIYGLYSYWYWNSELSKDGQASPGRYKSTQEVNVQLGEPKDVPAPLNGVLHTKSAAEIFMNRRPLVIMVNNHVAARPQFGLSAADIIYEAVAEGGITRFLAVYHSRDSEKVGPVRSARIYYEDWAAELQAWYAHWGGAYMTDEDKANRENPNFNFTCNPEADAYEKINRIGLPSLDQMWLGRTAYWRENDRGVAIEHTGFTSTQKLYKEATNRYPEKGWHDYTPIGTWLFKDDAQKAERPASGSLSFSFWNGYRDYDVRWKYNPEGNDYLRFQGGEKQVDAANNQELRAKDVIVQFTKESSFNDKKNHLNYETVGEGKAKIFLDGRVTDATWKKGSIRERTRYYNDATGEEIKFNRGQIWVEIVPAGNEISYSGGNQ